MNNFTHFIFIIHFTHLNDFIIIINFNHFIFDKISNHYVLDFKKFLNYNILIKMFHHFYLIETLQIF